MHYIYIFDKSKELTIFIEIIHVCVFAVGCEDLENHPHFYAYLALMRA
ncbi:17371_t:CDS:2 [Rhizophagus irregularis]|nr:17371_t:CDS:2 [Rhizophagus irregularis]